MKHSSTKHLIHAPLPIHRCVAGKCSPKSLIMILLLLVILTSVSGPVSGIPQTVQASGEQTNLVVPIDMLDYSLFSESGAGTSEFDRSQRSLDTGDFDGTVSYVWEVVVQNTDSTDKDVELLDSAGNVKATITVPTSATAATRQETSFTPNSGADIYNIRLAQTTSSNQLNVHSSTIVVTQTGATKTAIWVPLLARNSGSNVLNAIVDSTSSASYTQPVPDRYSYWRWVAAEWSTLKTTTPFKFEALIRVSSDGSTGSVSLFNATDNTQIAGSEVSHNTGTYTVKTATFDSSETNFDDLDEMEVRIKHSGTGSMNISGAGLWVRLDPVTKGETYWRVGRRGDISATSDINQNTWRTKINTASFSTPAVYFEATGRESVSGDIVATAKEDGTNESGGLGTNITGADIAFTGATKERQRTGALTITSGNRFYGRIEENVDGGTIIATSGWLVVAFQGAPTGTPFTESVVGRVWGGASFWGGLIFR